MNLRLLFFAVLLAAGTITLSLHAQSPTLPSPTVPTVEAAAMAQYWTLLAQGRYADAARTISEVLGRYPKNISALSLVVEGTIAQGGAGKALDVYEAWLGRRTLEEPGVVRRVARAYLYEWGRQTRDTEVRSEALLALARDGDTAAASALGTQAGEKAALPKASSASVDRLIAQLKGASGVKIREIQRLADTGSARAAAPLAALLSDPSPENRAAAAEALGKLGRQEAIGALRPVLQDPNGVVRLSAAGALFRLGDTSGAQILLDLASNENASMRLSAATLLASQPDENWKTLVRGLATDPDPSIRLGAARLIAPHEPEMARSTLETLSRDANLAIREEADLALAETSGSDFATLRRVLRSGNGRATVRAADRVLALTR